MSDNRGFEGVQRWWKRLITSNPDVLEIKTAMPRFSDDPWLGCAGSQEAATARDEGTRAGFAPKE